MKPGTGLKKPERGRHGEAGARTVRSCGRRDGHVNRFVVFWSFKATQKSLKTVFLKKFRLVQEIALAGINVNQKENKGKKYCEYEKFGKD